LTVTLSKGVDTSTGKAFEGTLKENKMATMAKIFLTTGAANDVVSNSEDEIFGSSASEGISIAADFTGVVVDSNTDTVILVGAIDAYSFEQAGNVLNIYTAFDGFLDAAIAAYTVNSAAFIAYNAANSDHLNGCVHLSA